MGDSWQISLTGTPGAAIGINGIDTGAVIGSNGAQQFSGTIPEGSEGTNSQYWTVGGYPANPYPLTFNVNADPSGCLSGINISYSGDMHMTDVLYWGNRYGDLDSEGNPGTAQVSMSLDPSPSTCSVSQYWTQADDDPEFIVNQMVSTNGTTVNFQLGDAGCQQGIAGPPRPCEWYWDNPEPQWNGDPNYPIVNDMFVYVSYRDSYNNDYPTAMWMVTLYIGYTTKYQ